MNIFNSLIRLFPTVLGLIFTFSTFASDFHSPRTSALGGAGHASPMLSDALYLNPAAGSYLKNHALSLNYQLATSNQHISNVAVLDGTEESLFQAGVAYTIRTDANLIHVGASHTIIQKLGAGLGGKFIFPNDNSGQRLVDATFSMIGMPAKWFQTAIIVDNLFETASNLGFLREFILGTKFDLDGIVFVFVDPHYVPNLNNGQNKFGVEAGLEFPFFSDVFFRLGWFSSATIPMTGTRGDGYAMGAGWVGPKLSLDYAVSWVTNPSSSFIHTFGMSIFF